MSKLLLIPTGSGGGGSFNPDDYYTKSDIDLMFQGVQSIQGLQGTTGQEGSQGIQGIKGSDGLNGADGLQGIQGIAGQNGTNGVDGSQGIQGIAGQNGANGQQGIQGIKGSDGTNGVDGQQGIQGIKGIDGINGEQGIQGIAGQNGTNGVDGLQGIQGTMGIQGPAGGGGGGTRYDISTKSQEELADFYQNWETVMASNDVYVGIYPVTSVIPEYTVEEFTALLLEFNINFALEDDETTETPIVNGVVGAYYILPNGMGGLYGTNVPLASKDYVDAVVSGIQAIQGIQGTAGTNGVDGHQGIQGTAGQNGTNGVDGLQGIQGIQGPSGGSTSKIELMTMDIQDQLQFYNDIIAGNVKDFSNYTVDGWQLFNAYGFGSGYEVPTPNGGTYTTDGTEVALLMNPRYFGRGSYANEDYQDMFMYITLFSPTIVMTYGATIDISPEVQHYALGAGTNISLQTTNDIKYISAGTGTVSLQFVFTDNTQAVYDVLIN